MVLEGVVLMEQEHLALERLVLQDRGMMVVITLIPTPVQVVVVRGPLVVMLLLL